jgi:hypothetical protein
MVLPNSMVIRNVLEAPVLAELAARGELEIAVLTPYAANAAAVAALGAVQVRWVDLTRPAIGAGLGYGGPAAVAARLLQRAAARLLRPWVGFPQLVYRFNQVQGFAGHRQKMALPPAEREREARAGNYADPALGRPLPGSRALLELIYRLHYARWYGEPLVEAFCDGFRPDLMVLHHLQNEVVRPWANAARRRGVPVLGVVGSWDQPTTKGPLVAGVDRYLVQSRRMREELRLYHGVPEERVEVTGWPQMDVYRRPGVIGPREELLAELGLPPGRRFILLGANSPRLGAHEPPVAAFLAQGLAAGDYGPDCSLVIRPHPKDGAWRERFGHLHAPPLVVVTPPELGRLHFLANLLTHAGLLLASFGSICLDAIALDTCVVNLVFDGGLEVPAHRSVAQWKDLDHYRPVVASGAMRLVASFDELAQAVAAYLDDPSLDATQRALCRAEQLEPLDGRSSHRVAQAIARMAGLA